MEDAKSSNQRVGTRMPPIERRLGGEERREVTEKKWISREARVSDSVNRGQ